MIYYGDELYHHGILGQKWGVRRYQNPDGTLTPAGKKRMLSVEKKLSKAANKGNTRYDRKQNKEPIKNIKSDEKKKNIDEESKARLAERRKSRVAFGLYVASNQAFRRRLSSFQMDSSNNVAMRQYFMGA